MPVKDKPKPSTRRIGPIKSSTYNAMAEAQERLIYDARPVGPSTHAFTPDGLAALRAAQEAFWAEVGEALRCKVCGMVAG